MKSNIPRMTTIFLLTSTNTFSNPSVFQWPPYIFGAYVTFHETGSSLLASGKFWSRPLWRRGICFSFPRNHWSFPVLFARERETFRGERADRKSSHKSRRQKGPRGQRKHRGRASERSADLATLIFHRHSINLKAPDWWLKITRQSNQAINKEAVTRQNSSTKRERLRLWRQSLSPLWRCDQTRGGGDSRFFRARCN